MASKKPKKQHYSPSRSLAGTKLHLVEVDAFIRPLEEFIGQIKQENVWVNEAGEAVMGLPHQDIEDLAKKGIAPPVALSSFAIMFETYFQVVAYCLDASAIQKAHDHIENINQKVFNPLEQNEFIEPQAIIEAESFLREMKSVFMALPKAKIIKVMNEIKRGIQASDSEVLNLLSLRDWLIKEVD